MSRSFAHFVSATALWYMTISPRSYDPPGTRWVAVSVSLNLAACFLNRIYAYEWSSNPVVRSWHTECHSSDDPAFLDRRGLLIPSPSPEGYPFSGVF